MNCHISNSSSEVVDSLLRFFPSVGSSSSAQSFLIFIIYIFYACGPTSHQTDSFRSSRILSFFPPFFAQKSSQKWSFVFRVCSLQVSYTKQFCDHLILSNYIPLLPRPLSPIPSLIRPLSPYLQKLRFCMHFLILLKGATNH